MTTDRTFVIVGASLAGATAAATLRGEGFDGRIALIGAEPLAPYERPPLSKEYLRGEQPLEDAFVRPPEWYAEQEIDARFGTRAVQIDVREREVVLAGGERIAFDRLLMATGSRNRSLDAPGAGLPGVFDLRHADDADRIKEAVGQGARVVCVGMGFIGAEVAASLRMLGNDVTVVEIFETTLYRILGPAIGRVLEAVHRDHGVKMLFNEAVASFEGDGRLEAVVTSGGRRIEADVAIVGVGTEPAVELMAGTGPGPGRRHPGRADARDRGAWGLSRRAMWRGRSIRSSVPSASSTTTTRSRWAKRPLGTCSGPRPCSAIPIGSGRTSTSPRSRPPGSRPTWDWMVVRGSLEERSFCAFLLDGDGVLRSTVSLDWPRDVRRSFGLIAAQVAPDPTALEDPDVDLRTLVP